MIKIRYFIFLNLHKIIHRNVLFKYIASGSDDFNVYIWRIPDNNDSRKIKICFFLFVNLNYIDTYQCQSSSHLNSENFVWNAHMILYGHRSVVNQVRYSSRLHTIASSGVEKVIKV